MTLVLREREPQTLHSFVEGMFMPAIPSPLSRLTPFSEKLIVYEVQLRGSNQLREAHVNNNNSAKRFKSTASSLKCEGLMHHPLSRDSMIPPKIPLTREVSLAQFFQKRKERIETMRLNNSDRFLQLKRKSDREAIDELNNPSTKRNCVLS